MFSDSARRASYSPAAVPTSKGTVMVATSDADMTLLHQAILALLMFTAISYAARCFFFRAEVRALLGFHDLLGELGHSVCALLMVPMVVPAWLADPTVRVVCAALSLAGGVLFTGEGLGVRLGWLTRYPEYKPWWSFAHGGMYLGMAEMYWVHDHVIVAVSVTTALNWIAGAFFLWFSGYYAYSLVADALHTRGRAKWALYLQSNVAHLFGIGLPMLGMIIWPNVFMPMAGAVCQPGDEQAQRAP
jgi:hypothetical protein